MLDRCMYSHRMVTEPLVNVVPGVQFLIISPSTLFYPIPERAVLPNLATATCIGMEPGNVLTKTYEFNIPTPDFMRDMSSVEKPDWSCHHWTKADEKKLFHDGSHQASMAQEHKLCESKASSLYEYKFTRGQNDDYVGCGACFCCKRPRSLKGHTDRCVNYNHYRYGPDGPLVPPDMHDSSGKVSAEVQKKALLGHNALYIAGSADVCNWIVQSAMSPPCGLCKRQRTLHSQPGQGFAFDIHSPILDTCGALWQGSTRLERMKVYRDAVINVLAPRLGISEAELSEKRKFLVLIGVGHDPDDAVREVAKCIVWDACSHGSLAPMETFLSGAADSMDTIVKEAEGRISADSIDKVTERASSLPSLSTTAVRALVGLAAVTVVLALPVRMLQSRFDVYPLAHLRAGSVRLAENGAELLDLEEIQTREYVM